MKLNIAVLYGSVRTDRQGIKAARFITDKFAARGHKVTLIDPLEHKLPMLDYMYKEYTADNAPEAIARLGGILDSADSYVVVTGEYNHSIPPVLKNMLDHYQREYFFKPTSIACYSSGTFGGVRAAVHLRAILAELGSPSLPTLFPIPFVQDAFDEKGVPVDEEYNSRVIQFVAEHEWYAKALLEKRKNGTPY